jgi:hypothetical protein
MGALDGGDMYSCGDTGGVISVVHGGVIKLTSATHHHRTPSQLTISALDPSLCFNFLGLWQGVCLWRCEEISTAQLDVFWITAKLSS